MSLSIFLIFSFISSIYTQTCNAPPAPIASMKPNFGGIEGFYGIAKGISDGLQSTPDAKTYKDLNNLVFQGSPTSTGDVVRDMVLNQIGAIIFWSVGFVFVLAAIVLGIATAIWQCCYTCSPKTSSSRSTICGIVYIVLLTSVFAFVLTGTILFNISENELVYSIDNGKGYTDRLSNDLSNFLNTGTNQMICEVNTTTDTVFTQINGTLGNYGYNVTNGVSNNIGLTAVTQFDDQGMRDKNTATETAADAFKATLDAMKIVDNAACTAQVKIFQDQFAGVKTNLDLFDTTSKLLVSDQIIPGIVESMNAMQDTIDKQAALAQTALTNSMASIQDQTDQISGIVTSIQHDIDNFINSLQAAQRDITTSDAYTAIQILVRLFVTIPACIGMIFAILAVVAIGFSIKSQSGVALKLAPLVLISFYVSIILSIIVILISSAAFVGGWAMSAICVPLFEDPSYKFFHLLNETTPSNYNVGDVFDTCTNDTATMYTAINGSSLFSAASITQNLDLDTYRAQTDANIMSMQPPAFNYKLDPLKKASGDLDTALQTAQATDLGECKDYLTDEVKNSRQSYVDALAVSVPLCNTYYDNLLTLQTKVPDTNTIAVNQNDAYFAQGDAQINASINTMMTSMQTDIFRCRPLVDIFTNGGYVVCQQYGKPIQGLWAAVGLAGLFTFILSILLLLTYRWLKTHEDQDLDTVWLNDNSSRRLGSKEEASYTNDMFMKPAIATAVIPRTRPIYDIDQDQQTTTADYGNMGWGNGSSTGTMGGLPRVQVLPDSRHPQMSPQFFDTETYGLRDRRYDNVDLYSPDDSVNSTRRGLRRF